jgi:hypothetical protein
MILVLRYNLVRRNEMDEQLEKFFRRYPEYRDFDVEIDDERVVYVHYGGAYPGIFQPEQYE